MTGLVYSKLMRLEVVAPYRKSSHSPSTPQPYVHILHDRAPANVAVFIEPLLKALNMGMTLVWPTCLVQILDVGVIRSMRAGMLAQQVTWFRANMSEIMSLAKYRQLAIIWVCKCWFFYIPEALLGTVGKHTASTVSLAGDEDSLVDVSVGQYQIPFTPCREKGLKLAEETKSKALPQTQSYQGSPAHIDYEAVQKLEQEIEVSCRNRAVAKEEAKAINVAKKK